MHLTFSHHSTLTTTTLPAPPGTSRRSLPLPRCHHHIALLLIAALISVIEADSTPLGSSSTSLLEVPAIPQAFSSKALVQTYDGVPAGVLGRVSYDYPHLTWRLDLPPLGRYEIFRFDLGLHYIIDTEGTQRCVQQLPLGNDMVPFHVPPYAAFVGNVMHNDDLVQLWNATWPYDDDVEIDWYMDQTIDRVTLKTIWNLRGVEMRKSGITQLGFDFMDLDFSTPLPPVTFDVGQLENCTQPSPPSEVSISGFVKGGWQGMGLLGKQYISYTTGGHTKSVETDNFGLFTLAAAVNESIVLNVTAPGFYPSFKEFIPSAGIPAGTFADLHMSRIPKALTINESYWEVVLTWNDSPLDLDAHVVGGGCNVNYTNRNCLHDGTSVVLNVDVTAGWGAEIIQLKDINTSDSEDGVFKYFVRQFSSGFLSLSNARLVLYNNKSIVADIFVPQANKDSMNYKYWFGFTIDVNNNNFTVVNQLCEKSPADPDTPMQPLTSVNWVILGVILSVSCATIVIVIGIIVYGKWNVEGNNPSRLEAERSPLLTGGNETIDGIVFRVTENPEISWTQIDEIVIDQKLGEGHFAEVYSGIWNPNRPTLAIKVALKRLKNSVHSHRFLREAALLETLEHPNILRYFGVHIAKEQLYIVTEFMSEGSLDALLQSYSHKLKEIELLGLVRDAAAGMVYLESKMCVHRDLGARNLLVLRTESGFILKVADFGLSRLMDRGYYKSDDQHIPYKWCAPEVIMYGKYSSKSDVWSFGIVLWEVFAFGQLPYSSMTNQETVNQVLKGYRLPQPRGCPISVYKLMQDCWKQEPEDRPNFQEISTRIKNIIAPFVLESKETAQENESQYLVAAAFLAAKRDGELYNPEGEFDSNRSIFYEDQEIFN